MINKKPNKENSQSINDDLIYEDFIDDLNSPVVLATNEAERIVEESRKLIRSKFTKYLKDYYGEDSPHASFNEGKYYLSDESRLTEYLWVQWQIYCTADKLLELSEEELFAIFHWDQIIAGEPISTTVH